MGWRTVAISKQAKLDYSMGFMVVRDTQNTTKIYIEEISILIVENTAVSITAALLGKLIENKVDIVFCDEKRNPSAQLLPLYGSYDCSKALKTQISWDESSKQLIWTSIVREKINNQAKLLLREELIDPSNLLMKYLNELEFNDVTNREGHAAKVYFNALFGKFFSRNDDNPINAALNYGYSLILSCISREIVCCGFSTKLGIHHDNQFNQFNLSCDLMEPFRPLVDFKVISALPKKFEKEEKSRVLSLLSDDIMIADSQNTYLNAIKIYTRSVLTAITEQDASLISFPKMSYEL